MKGALLGDRSFSSSVFEVDHNKMETLAFNVNFYISQQDSSLSSMIMKYRLPSTYWDE
jgi:hypothetical protein